jgi:hypothetical protein
MIAFTEAADASAFNKNLRSVATYKAPHRILTSFFAANSARFEAKKRYKTIKKAQRISPDTSNITYPNQTAITFIPKHFEQLITLGVQQSGQEFAPAAKMQFKRLGRVIEKATAVRDQNYEVKPNHKPAPHELA